MITAIRNVTRQGWREYTTTELSCGHWTAGPIAVGTCVDCHQCEADMRARAMVADCHAAGDISHTRAGNRLMSGKILVYVRKPDSPTGVQYLTALDDTRANYDFLRTLNASYSPLSPTESR